jgi:hypothetical protein
MISATGLPDETVKVWENSPNKAKGFEFEFNLDLKLIKLNCISLSKNTLKDCFINSQQNKKNAFLI